MWGLLYFHALQHACIDQLAYKEYIRYEVNKDSKAWKLYLQLLNQQNSSGSQRHLQLTKNYLNPHNCIIIYEYVYVLCLTEQHHRYVITTKPYEILNCKLLQNSTCSSLEMWLHIVSTHPQWLWLFSAHFLINTCSTFLATSSAIIFFWKRHDPFKQRNSNAKLFLRLYIRGFKLILLCAPHIPHCLLNWATPVKLPFLSG